MHVNLTRVDNNKTSAKQFKFLPSCVCLSVCLSVSRITQKVVDGFWWNVSEQLIVQRLNSFLRRYVKLGYYSSNDPPTISSIADDVEDTLFKSILRNAQHVLQPYGRATSTALPPKKPTWNQQDSDRQNCGPQWQRFLVRNLFKVSYWTHSYIYIITAFFLLFLNAILRPFSDYYHV